MITRRSLQSVLGIIWLLDGVLQLKSPMFTNAFVQQVILPTAQGQPAWIAYSIRTVAEITAPHIAIYNALFAVVQLLIGIGLLVNYRTKLTLSISFIWALQVWWFGEGLGQLLTGQSLLLTGAPGAVLLYALIGWALWPRRKQTTGFETSDIVSEPSVSEGGSRFARYAIGGLWVLGAVLQFQTSYLSPQGLASVLAPNFVIRLVSGDGIAWTIVLAIVELTIGVGMIRGKNLPLFGWASIIVSFLFWWVGQSFGDFWTGLGTDPNSGPLFMLLTLCAVPSIWKWGYGSKRKSLFARQDSSVTDYPLGK